MVRLSIPPRASGPDRRQFERLGFHNWYGCKGCGAVVWDWARHGCHDHDEEEGQAAELKHVAPAAAGDLAARARAEGNAVVEASVWRQAWRQVRDVLRLRPEDTRPAVRGASLGASAAGRAEQWARIDGLIERTTRAQTLRREWGGW